MNILLPPFLQNHAELAMGIGTENEQRASLEVLGQATKMEKIKSIEKSNHFAAKNHKNSTAEDVKARYSTQFH